MRILKFTHPERGYDLICCDQYMYLGDLTGNLPIESRDARFGEHLFIAGVSAVIQIGDERGYSLWTMLRMEEGSSLLYLGILKEEKNEMMVFEPQIGGKRKQYRRNLFGTIGDLPYKNLFVAFNRIGESELHITTRNLAPRCFRAVVRFAEINQCKAKIS